MSTVQVVACVATVVVDVMVDLVYVTRVLRQRGKRFVAPVAGSHGSHENAPERDDETRKWQADSMEIVDRLWRQQLDRALGSVRNDQPEHLKVRVFGAPAVAQQRLAEAIETLRTNSYVFADSNAIATSPWFTVTDVRFTRSQTRT